MKRLLKALLNLLLDLFAKARRSDELAQIDKQLRANALEIADAMEKHDADRLNCLLADRRLLNERRKSLLAARQ